uniref:Pre-rRNA-processing protein TSR2 homolog n=1 Tax=Brassica campestris TaxID=3711 RepID=M4FAD6_BRACM
MDSRPSGPVVLTVEEKAVLNEGIGLILSRWTAMRAAVDNGWGGRDSHLKAERTVSNVLDYFIRLKDPTMGFDGLADILENGLNELNTLADDGSLEEVTETLIDLYYECLEGNYQRVEKLRVTSSQTSAKVVKVSNGNDEDEDDEESDDEDDDEDTKMSNVLYVLL